MIFLYVESYREGAKIIGEERWILIVAFCNSLQFYRIYSLAKGEEHIKLKLHKKCLHFYAGTYETDKIFYLLSTYKYQLTMWVHRPKNSIYLKMCIPFSILKNIFVHFRNHRNPRGCVLMMMMVISLTTTIATPGITGWIKQWQAKDPKVLEHIFGWLCVIISGSLDFMVVVCSISQKCASSCTTFAHMYTILNIYCKYISYFSLHSILASMI